MIGSGSFGHVYKAVKRIEGIFYAVKISKEKISKRTSHKMVQLNKEICALSVLGKSRFGSSLSVVDYLVVGSVSSLRSFGRK